MSVTTKNLRGPFANYKKIINKFVHYNKFTYVLGSFQLYL